MITLHIDIEEKDNRMMIRARLSGMPTNNEEMVAQQLRAIVGEAVSARVASEKAESPQEPKKQKRKRR